MFGHKRRRIKELESILADTMRFDRNKMETYLYHAPENGVYIINHNLQTLDVKVERYDSRGNPVPSNYQTIDRDRIKLLGIYTPERIIVRRL